MLKSVGPLICVIALLRGAPPPQQAPAAATFHSGTRLVEVEVVVRDKNGPVKGLTRDDFTVLDQGRTQSIAIFRASSSSTAALAPAPLPAGAVSNRVDSRGEPLTGATVVLLDQLNPVLDLKGYARKGVTRLLRSLTATDRIALYSLGKDLHVLQDFTDDPQKLVEALSKLDPGLDLLPADLETISQGLPDPSSIHTGDPVSDGLIRNSIAATAGQEAANAASIREDITVRALRLIIQHLAGVTGRKNLVWLQQEPRIPTQVMAMLLQANISLYPVLIRGVGESGVLSGTFASSGRLPALMGNAQCIECARRHAVEDLGAATGGAGFTDSLDLTTAMRTAEEDAANSYVLGYYPAEELLDGRYHKIAVKVPGRSLQLRYRPGYLATRTAPPMSTLSAQALLNDPLDSTGVGLSARILADPNTPGKRQIRLVIDLHDIHLESKGGQNTGEFEVVMANPFTHWSRSARIPINVSDAQLQQDLQSGLTLTLSGVDPQTGEIHIAVRDRNTGAAGSLRVPLPKD